MDHTSYLIISCPLIFIISLMIIPIFRVNSGVSCKCF